jgi:putative restriction endonuclease
MQGTIAITDYGWYQRLRLQPDLEEVNFWKPSATRAFRAPEFSPFFFKLKAPQNAICGFGYFSRYARLPDWLAWESFHEGNGCESLQEMRQRIAGIRERMRFRGLAGAAEIGCVLIVQPVFFPLEEWVTAPRDWPVRTQVDKKYDLTHGEGERVWRECLAVAGKLKQGYETSQTSDQRRPTGARYGSPVLITPRLGQGTFRIAVLEAYGRACAITGEHSLPALDAAHIRPYDAEGPHDVRNGVLLRADFHRLFDKGYLTISADYKLSVSRRLSEDFANGKSYYPYQGHSINLPPAGSDRPAKEYLEWHRECVYLG